MDFVTFRSCRLNPSMVFVVLRGVDICNIRLSDIDWNKDVIYLKQQKTGHFLNIPLRQSYGNIIAEYILSERPACKSDYLFVRELAPFSRLDGEGASKLIYVSNAENVYQISLLHGDLVFGKLKNDGSFKWYGSSTELESFPNIMDSAMDLIILESIARSAEDSKK